MHVRRSGAQPSDMARGVAACANASAATSTLEATPPWRRPIVVVPSVFDEWQSSLPVWACPNATSRYAVAWPLYQRKQPLAPRFVPNHAYEAGVYLKFVVDHYEQGLPDVMVFLQADAQRKIADLRQRIDSLRVNAVRSVGYLPLNGRAFRGGGPAGLVRNRSTRFWRSFGEPVSEAVARCWRTVAAWFGSAHIFDHMAHPTVTFYPCNSFAVSRESVQRHTLATWRSAYERMVVNGSCAPPQAPGEPSAEDRLAAGKHTVASAFEHLAHVVWGGAGAQYDGPRWSPSAG